MCAADPVLACSLTTKPTNVRSENLNGHVGNGERPGDGFPDHEDQIAKTETHIDRST